MAIGTGKLKAMITALVKDHNPGGTTYGALTNVQILALVSPSDLDNVFSTDDFIIYTFYTPNWYSTSGGVLV